MDESKLLGLQVTALKVAPDESGLIFETPEGAILWAAYGDCCSETWFADITGVDALLNHVVMSVERVSLEDPAEDDGRGRQEVDQYYGVKIVTNAGYVDIVYRNSSNGYYGGDYEEFPLAPDGVKNGVYDCGWNCYTISDVDNWESITSDWSA